MDGITYQLEEQTLSSLPKDIASLSAEQIIALTSDETKGVVSLVDCPFQSSFTRDKVLANMEEISNPKEVFGFLINVKTEWNRGKVGYTVTTDGHWTSSCFQHYEKS